MCLVEERHKKEAKKTPNRSKNDVGDLSALARRVCVLQGLADVQGRRGAG